MKIANISKLGLRHVYTPSLKCWVFPCMIRAIAEAGGKTSDELVDELGIREAYETSIGIKKECNVHERSRESMVSPPDELGPGDWHEDHDYTFSGGA